MPKNSGTEVQNTAARVARSVSNVHTYIKTARAIAKSSSPG